MPRTFNIRLFRAADMDRLLEIEGAIFDADAYDRNLFAEYFHKCGDLFLVAERRGNIWGYMITCTRGKGAPESAELISVAVDPAFHRKGVASVLLESTLRRLRRRGVARFTLMVKVTNEGALRFYRKYGFTKVRVVREYYEDRADGYRMVKVL